MSKKKRMSEASVTWLTSLLATARTAPYLMACENLSQAEGIVGLARIEQMISEAEHETYWATINEIRGARIAARRKLEEATV